MGWGDCREGSLRSESLCYPCFHALYNIELLLYRDGLKIGTAVIAKNRIGVGEVIGLDGELVQLETSQQNRLV